MIYVTDPVRQEVKENLRSTEQLVPPVRRDACFGSIVEMSVCETFCLEAVPWKHTDLSVQF